MFKSELIIEIDDDQVTEKTIQAGNSKFSVHEQTGWLHSSLERYPQKCTLQLADGQRPHSIGRYAIKPSSITINRFGNIQLKKVLDLDPLTE